MKMTMAKRLVQALIAPLAAVVLLAACGSVTLVAPYDAEIEKRLSTYNEDLVTFVANMSFKYGTHAGTYSENEGFYAQQTGVLQTLILRAEAQDPGKGCLMAGKATELLGARLPGIVSPQSTQATGSTSGCTVKMLQNIKLQLDALRTVHQVKKVVRKAQGGQPAVEMTGIKTTEAVSIIDGTSRAVRAVLAVELLKKKGELNNDD